ncbi:ankyrin repeat domain-containing protein [Candidatus Babeliales bacterium]|nr:ankyrin repeat domain-containing protein [Candidatus Babeliales bacterium]
MKKFIGLFFVFTLALTAKAMPAASSSSGSSSSIEKFTQEEKDYILLCAVRNGNKEKATQCIKAGANVNALDEDGWTPLHEATANNNKEMVELLLDYRADPNVKDEDGKTPLRWAMERGYKAIGQLLAIESTRQEKLTDDDFDNETNHTRSKRSSSSSSSSRMLKRQR